MLEWTLAGVFTENRNGAGVLLLIIIIADCILQSIL